MNETKMLENSDRILLIEQIPGESTKGSTGLLDDRVFKGGNKLHAVKDVQSNLWTMRYDSGVLPASLKQSFTSFSLLFRYAQTYFNKRGLRISGVEA